MKSTIKWFNVSCFAFLTLPALVFAAASSTNTKLLLPQTKKAQSQLSATDWGAVCTIGSPANPSGCLGNASSEPFQNVSNGTGGFTSWANIKPVNAPDSVYIKAFLAGTNSPESPPNISVNVLEGAARCGLFTTQGESIGVNGINNLNPTPGTSLMQSAPFGLIIALNSSAGGFSYEHAPAPFEADPPDPIYLMCVAYDPADGASAVSTAGSIIAK